MRLCPWVQLWGWGRGIPRKHLDVIHRPLPKGTQTRTTGAPSAHLCSLPGRGLWPLILAEGHGLRARRIPKLSSPTAGGPGKHSATLKHLTQCPTCLPQALTTACSHTHCSWRELEGILLTHPALLCMAGGRCRGRGSRVGPPQGQAPPLWLSSAQRAIRSDLP